MALPNPALTFQQTAITVCASTGKEDVITALEAAINSLTGTQGWTAATIDGDAAATPATLISAPSGSPIANFRAIVGFADGSNPASARMLSPDSRQTDHGFVAIGPDGRTGSTNWYDADPFGGGKRTSGFWGCFDANVCTKVWCIASAETLTVVWRGSNDSQLQTFSVGALVDPCDAASAESDERIYGMFTNGCAANWIPAAWFSTNSATNPLRHSNGNGQGHFGVFDPASPSSWLLASIPVSALIMNANASRTAGGNVYLHSLAVHEVSTSTQIQGTLGRLRGICPWDHALARDVLQDSTPADRGYAVGNSLTVASDTFIWANE